MANCIVCEAFLNKNYSPQLKDGTSYHIYECSVCGDFWWDTSMFDPPDSINLNDKKTRAMLSHYIRLKQSESKRVYVTKAEVTEALKPGELPTIARQGDEFVRWLGEAQEKPSDYVWLDVRKIGAVIGTMDIGAASASEGLIFVLGDLRGRKLIEKENEGEPLNGRYRLTPTGRRRYEELLSNEASAGKRRDA